MPITREEHISYTRDELKNREYYKNVIKILKENKISSYVDIGANIGEFCNTLLDYIPSLKHAYLIEPEMLNFDFLKKHLKDKNNIYYYNVAIGYNLKNPLLINHPTMNVGGFMLIEKDKIQDESLVLKNNIKVLELEELNLPIVDLIKMDIEGGEFNIIENSKYLQTAKFIEIEFHKDYKNKKELTNYLYEYLPNYNYIIIEEPLYGRALLQKK